MDGGAALGPAHLLWDQSLELLVEHEVEAGEGNIPDQSRPKAPGQATESLSAQDGAQRMRSRAVVVGSGLEPGLDHGEGDHHAAGQGPGRAPDHGGLEGGGPAVTEAGLHVVHGGEVEADSGDCADHAGDQTPPQAPHTVLAHHAGDDPDQGGAGARLLDAGLDQVQGLEQERGAGAAEGPGQEGLHHWVHRKIHC